MSPRPACGFRLGGPPGPVELATARPPRGRGPHQAQLAASRVGQLERRNLLSFPRAPSPSERPGPPIGLTSAGLGGYATRQNRSQLLPAIRESAMPLSSCARPARIRSVLFLSLAVVPLEAVSRERQQETTDEVSPTRKIERRAAPPAPVELADRTTARPMVASTISPIPRWVPDTRRSCAGSCPPNPTAISSLAGETRPSARAVGNAVHAQAESLPNPHGASGFPWQWGQFLDHDIDLTEGVDSADPGPIPVPAGDPLLRSDGHRPASVDFNHSIWDASTGTGPANSRQQVNEITAWIDASNVYGSAGGNGGCSRLQQGAARGRLDRRRFRGKPRADHQGRQDVQEFALAAARRSKCRRRLRRAAARAPRISPLPWDSQNRAPDPPSSIRDQAAQREGVRWTAIGVRDGARAGFALRS